MSLDLFGVAALFWGLALLLAASCRSAVASRAALALGIVVALAGCAASALNDSRAAVPLFFSGAILVRFRIDPAAAWLLGWGLVAALATIYAGTPAHRPRLWTSGASLSLLGALGVAGGQDGVSFLIASELMSLGGAALLLGDRQGPMPQNGCAALFMLALLEVGLVALLAAILILRRPAYCVCVVAHHTPRGPEWCDLCDRDTAGRGLWRQTRPAPILRVVSGGLWRGERGQRGAVVRGDPERRMVWSRARDLLVVAAVSGANRLWRAPGGGRDTDCRARDPVRLPAGRLATSAGAFICRKRRRGRGRPGGGGAVSPGPPPASRRIRV